MTLLRLLCSSSLLAAPVFGQVDVPLRQWRNNANPDGLQLGISNGVSIGDFDADGWVDVACLWSGNLWRNIGGRDWRVVADLTSYWPTPPGARYSASFGDFDLDGLPDLATEPRLQACLHLLRNLGNGVFRDLAAEPEWIDDMACFANAETNCWGDVDGDGDLDLFVPIYPSWTLLPSIGNHFFVNTGPEGSPPFSLRECAGDAGLENFPLTSNRPEGAQMVDVDGDGDLDVYSNGTLYQNRSLLGTPRFEWLGEAASGIGNHDVLDEGAAFGDHDLDGDFDLYIAYASGPPGVCIWENQGDGTFFDVGPGIIAMPGQGLALGLSIADWDLDGDLDFTTRQIFRRNMFVELGGVRRYEVASHNIPAGHLTQATPAWADWDRDGDMDCVLGNMGTQGHIYDSILYDEQPEHLKRYLRIKPVSEYQGTTVESQYGAEVEIRVHGEDPSIRRVGFNASGHGYVNQSEYTIHLALPPHPQPDQPDQDLRFDLVVHFPSVVEQGTWMVDGSINPILADIDLATLPAREFWVYRDGRVLLDGVEYPPVPGASPRLTTAGGELLAADPMVGLPDPVDPPTDDHWVGLALDDTAEDLWIRELVLDVHLGPAVDCGNGVAGNVLVVDVTDPSAPFVAAGGALDLTTSDRNHRTCLPVAVALDAERDYRVMARVQRLRQTAWTGPVQHDELRVTGSLSLPHPGSCPLAEVAAAAPETRGRAMTVRFSPRP